MSDIVLVHGAFRGGWAWDRVRPRLLDHGHRVFTPDLTAPDATLETYIDQISGIFVDNDLRMATLVGHSQGGFVVRAAAEVIAERVHHLVYFDAPVPSDGESAFDFRPAGAAAPAVEPDAVIDPRPVTAGPGLDASDAAWINARLVGQPVAPSTQPVRLQNPAAAALPATHVFFDRTPPGFPCEITRARLAAAGTSVVTIDAPHDGVITNPTEVAAVILRSVASSGE